LDSYGNAHISYIDNANGGLRYAYRDAAGWHFETIEEAGDNVALVTSLALDGDGTLTSLTMTVIRTTY